MDKDDVYFMKKALMQAEAARRKDEVPVGAVIVKDGRVVARGHNTRENAKNPCGHAEMAAIQACARKLGGWRLCGCTLYVTLEPCPMCTGAIINARIPRVVFGAYDPKAGCMGSKTDLMEIGFNHRAEIKGGVMEEECRRMISGYFAEKRRSKKQTEKR